MADKMHSKLRDSPYHVYLRTAILVGESTVRRTLHIGNVKRRVTHPVIAFASMRPNPSVVLTGPNIFIIFIANRPAAFRQFILEPKHSFCL